MAAEQHAAMGERRLEHQRAIVDRRRSQGQDSSEAEELLIEFEQQQTSYRGEVDRLRELLAAIP